MIRKSTIKNFFIFLISVVVITLLVCFIKSDPVQKELTENEKYADVLVLYGFEKKTYSEVVEEEQSPPPVIEVRDEKKSVSLPPLRLLVPLKETTDIAEVNTEVKDENPPKNPLPEVSITNILHNLFPISEESEDNPPEEIVDSEPVVVIEEEPPKPEGCSVDDPMGSDFLAQINEIRQSHGLVALTPTSELCRAATVRAEEASRCWSHTRPSGKPFWTVSNDIIGENLAFSYSPEETVINDWMNSPSHRAIILADDIYTVGIAVYYSQDGCVFVALEVGG